MPIISNGNGNCFTDLIGSGQYFCDPDTLGDLVGFILHAKGTGRYPLTGDLKALLLADIKNMRAFPYTGLNGFENSNAENEMNTSNLGIMSVVRTGKPSFTFTFIKGTQQHKSLYNKMANGKWDITLIFEKGFFRAQTSDNLISEPFTASVVSVSSLNLLTGTDPQNSSVVVQLSNASQFNERNTFIRFEDNDISETDYAGVVETLITFSTPPSAGDPLVIKIASAGNSQNFVNVFDSDDDFKVTVTAANGTNVDTTAVVSVNTDTNEIQLIPTPALVAGQKVRVSLTSTASGTVYPVAVDEGGIIFKGSTPLTTVVA